MIERIPKLLLQILQNRFELVSLEMQEEKVRLTRLIVLLLWAATLGLTAVLGLGVLIVWLVPDGARLWTAAGLIAAMLACSAMIALVARRQSRRHRPFEATVSTLQRDIQDL